jgi:hypothetical protein
MSKYIIEKISVEDVKEFDKIKYNTNNHWTNRIDPMGLTICDKPNDYNETIERGSTYHWIDKFRKFYTVININNSDLSWLKKASLIGNMTARFPNMYVDDLNDFLERNSDLNELFSDNKQYFVRTDTVSLKYGMHGVGPYNNLKNIMESLVTSVGGHSPVNMETTSLKIYLLQWKNFNKYKEYRCFVYNNKITAISQQSLYSENKFLKEFPDIKHFEIISHHADIIINYFEKTIKEKINQNNYTIDIVILDDNSPYFIEINCFGKEYAAGSSLFHWLIDEDILYGKKDSIYIRVTV